MTGSTVLREMGTNSYLIVRVMWLLAVVAIIEMMYSAYDSRTFHAVPAQIKSSSILDLPGVGQDMRQNLDGKILAESSNTPDIPNIKSYNISGENIQNLTATQQIRSIKLPMSMQNSNLNTSLNFIIPNSQICLKFEPQVLVWALSAAGNFERRRSIRNTWGNSALYEPMKVRVVFSLAVTTDSNTQNQIEEEQARYGDIIQDGSFIDAYRNLTYKSQGMIKWSSVYCKNVKLLFKVDDDTFLLPARFSKWLHNFDVSNSWPENSVLGIIWYEKHPTRRPSSKWSVTKKEWPKSTFAPKACPGLGYLITGDALPKMVSAISKVPFLWLEDMYLTGVVAEEARLDHIDNSNQQIRVYHENTTQINIIKDTSVYVIGHMPSVDDVYDFWNLVKGYS